MQVFSLKDVLEVVGTTASLVFASWLFLSLLQQRYSSGFDRYRELVEMYRKGLEGPRKQVVREQILLYKVRIRYMRYSTNLGLGAAVLLILSLMMGALEAMVGGDLVKYAGTVCVLLGLAMVIVAALLMAAENLLIVKAIDSELTDIADLRG